MIALLLMLLAAIFNSPEKPSSAASDAPQPIVITVSGPPVFSPPK